MPVATVGTLGVADREIAYIDISSIDNIANRISEPKRLKLSEAPSRARQIVQAGDVLFSTVRPYLRNIARVPGALDGQVASTGFAVLRAAEGIVPAYLFYKAISRDFVAVLTGEQYGVSYPAVKDEQVRAQPFELPPTREQHRIVEKIEELFSELDKAVESLTLARAQLKTYRQSLLKAAFEGKLTADWRAANPDKLEPLETLLARIRAEREARYEQALSDWQTAVAEWCAGGEAGRKPRKPARQTDIEIVENEKALAALPAGWIWCKVEGLLAEPLTNGRSVKDKAGGFPVLRLTALQGGRLNLAEFKEGDWTREDAEAWLVKEGDFFAARGNGSKHLVGIGSLALQVSAAVAYPDTMIRISVDNEIIDREYFAAVWNSRFVRRQIEAAARTTAGIYKINQPHICDFVIPLPLREEQSAILSRIAPALSEVDHQETDIDTALAKTNALRQSILKKAFSGQLVPQDPTDEPAAALLARLREQAPPARTRLRKTT